MNAVEAALKITEEILKATKQQAMPLESLFWALITLTLILAVVASWFYPPKFLGEKGLRKVGFTTSIAVVVVGLLYLIVKMFASDYVAIPENQRDFIVYLGSMIGGLLVIINAVMLYRRVIALEAESAQNRLKAEQDRFNAGMEHLSNAQANMKTVAYHELIQLARSTDNTELRKHIFSILCDHLRQYTNEPEYKKEYTNKPSEGIQTLLDLLFKLDGKYIFADLSVDLWRVYLVGADLSHAFLKSPNFENANLRQANFREAEMSASAIFHGAQLQGTCFEWAKMKIARFHNAKMHNANLNWAVMHQAFLVNTELQNAELFGTELQNAELNRVNFQSACLADAMLQHADITYPDFRGSVLIDVGMQEAEIRNGKFGGVSAIYIPDEPEHWESTESRNRFEHVIRYQLAEEGDLSGCIFDGGLTPDDMYKLTEEMSPAKADDFRRRMQKHVKVEKILGTSEECEKRGINISAYDKEEVEKMINKYDETIKDISE